MNFPGEVSPYLKNAAAFTEAFTYGKILQARATVCTATHDLIVDLGFCKGIIPRNEGALGIEEGVTKDIAIISKVNKAVCFKILSLNADESGNLHPILSRRMAQRECSDNYLSHLISGDIVEVKVTHLEPFGCFVDIGCGIASLIPIDNISVSRISHPSDRFYSGQIIKAVVRSTSDGRITLSHKELLGTWEQNAALFSSGEAVAGIVRSVEDYGIFVELTPNLAGLAEYKSGVYAGQQASVYIKSLLPEKMKVKLIIVDAFDASYQIEPPHYFIETGHIDRFVYSPSTSQKLIETVFENS
ncbi:MAG: S1 RNA-binding domain-containing protein [Oscillospiraceae bacterium]